MAKIRVEIWSDIICLWCPIGKAQFDMALSRFEHRDDVEVRHRSFELAPDHPRDLVEPLIPRAARDMGASPARAEQILSQVASLGASVGLDYKIEQISAVNSFDAHRLVHLAADYGLTEAVRRRLMAAYTGEGAVLSDRETLLRLAGEAGLDLAETAAVLDGDRYAEAVRADEALAANLGVHGVPSYIMDGRISISGSQSADVLVEALEHAWQTAA